MPPTTLAGKAAVGFAVGCFGDSVGQALHRRGQADPQPFDARRTLLWGAAVAGIQVPLFHTWFRFLDRRITGSGFVVGLRKSLYESLTVGPLYLIAVNVWASLVINRGIFSDNPIGGAKDRIVRVFPDSMLTAWCTVAPAQLLSHTFLPQQYKLLYLNVVSMLWNIVLTQMIINNPPAEASGE